MKDWKWWALALALFFLVGFSAWETAKYNELRDELELAKMTAQTAMWEQENAKILAEQWQKQYTSLLMELAELREENEALKAKNEELTLMFEETSFALDEVCYETGWTQLGTFQITHYCNCAKCCGKWANGLTATGTVPTEGRTIAVDPSVIPLGSIVRIKGHNYIAEDTGVKGHVIDIFVNDHNYALQLGTYKTDVEWRTA